MTSKRCSFILPVIFIIKTITLSCLVRILKRDNQLNLFRRLEQISIKQINCQCSIEFLRLCESFDLTPTFARVGRRASETWKHSSNVYSRNVIAEELRSKHRQNVKLKEEMSKIYEDIRQSGTTLRYLSILNVITKLRKKHYQRVMSKQVKKISRLLYKTMDVDKHIQNLSSYKLSFFEKLVLCRGLNFAFPQDVRPLDIKASFEKAYWLLEPKLSDDLKELTASTLRSIAINYAQRKGPKPPKTLLKAIKRLKSRDDIVVTKPDKGTGVVVMNKCDYLKLLADASVSDASKFRQVSLERPKKRGRPSKHFHPLLEKEKLVKSVLGRILPKSIASSLCPSGSRLAHLYGLPKTHKKNLSMRPILSATKTYNYDLAKWLELKLKPLSINAYTITDTFKFADEIRDTTFNDTDIIVSYDVVSLFTSVPLDETIALIADKAFVNDWFNATYGLKITKSDLIELLTIATKDQLFQFNGLLYEQTNGVAMGSPLGPLLANAFMCNLEEQLDLQNKLPSYYRRYVDDTLTTMPDIESAKSFLWTLNQFHPSVDFTMEIANENTLPFLGMTLHKVDGKIMTSVYVKPTHTGLLLHYDSHVDSRYKRSLIITMLDRAFKLSSHWSFFLQECDRLSEMFKQLNYPDHLINNVISSFVSRKSSTTPLNQEYTREADCQPVRIVIPYKDQKSADKVRNQLYDLSKLINKNISPVFTSHKIAEDLKYREHKPDVINQQSIVYLFECGWCDASYVGYTRRHLHQRIDEHNYTGSIFKHLEQCHEKAIVSSKCFRVLKKCSTKLDCLIYEMFCIRDLKPSLNIQSDSVKAKLFTQ